ncbi:hypothetical protein DL93DRAFT_2088674 [Clavulina sp. PMI_390]|nr:hypothetical protein DL93DRAFT_2088674 [Clavulina sp. PMI_390]
MPSSAKKGASSAVSKKPETKKVTAKPSNSSTVKKTKRSKGRDEVDKTRVSGIPMVDQLAHARLRTRLQITTLPKSVSNGVITLAAERHLAWLEYQEKAAYDDMARACQAARCEADAVKVQQRNMKRLLLLSEFVRTEMSGRYKSRFKGMSAEKLMEEYKKWERDRRPGRRLQ